MTRARKTTKRIERILSGPKLARLNDTQRCALHQIILILREHGTWGESIEVIDALVEVMGTLGDEAHKERLQ